MVRRVLQRLTTAQIACAAPTRSTQHTPDRAVVTPDRHPQATCEDKCRRAGASLPSGPASAGLRHSPVRLTRRRRERIDPFSDAPAGRFRRCAPSSAGSSGTRDADADLAPIAELAKTLGAEVEMQAILAADSDTAGAAELAALADACKAAGLQVARIAALPKVDEGSFQPGQDRPPHAADTAIAAALADSFPGAAHIGGTPAFFTEFNRKRPDPALWDGLTFSTAPVVHAAEDRSVMETLEALPHILASATDLSGGLPISIGPTGIGMRINPYGPAPTENDPEKREGMAARDPRQRGLFAGAWSVGYLARIAPFAPDRFAFGAPTGPFGLISTPQSYTRAFWDDQPDGALYPLFHAARWIAGAGGAEVVSARTENGVAHIVWQTESGRRALVANLTVDLAPVPGLDVTAPHSVCLDAETLPSLMNIPAPRPSPGLPDNLDAYAILYCEEGAGT